MDNFDLQVLVPFPARQVEASFGRQVECEIQEKSDMTNTHSDPTRTFKKIMKWVKVVFRKTRRVDCSSCGVLLEHVPFNYHKGEMVVCSK